MQLTEKGIGLQVSERTIVSVCIYLQVLWMRDLLKRGVAVHHSGILPIIKEVRQFEVCVHSAVGVLFHCLQTKDVRMSSIRMKCVCVSTS